VQGEDGEGEADSSAASDAEEEAREAAGEAAKEAAQQAGDEAGPGERAGTQGTQTAEERGEELDGKLAEALDEFDREMLAQQEVLARQRTSASAAGGGGAGSSGGRGGGEGGSGETAGTEGVSSPEGGEDNSEGGAVGGGEGAREPDQGGHQRTDHVPSDIPDGRGDDIVARQLREAAMEEDDPRLREKLWDEYRRYKGLPIPKREDAVSEGAGSEDTAGEDDGEPEPTERSQDSSQVVEEPPGGESP